MTTDGWIRPAHVPEQLVKPFDFRTGIVDRPQEAVGALLDGPPVFFSPVLHHPLRKGVGAWIVVGAEETREVLGNPDRFPSTGFGSYADSVGESWRLTPLEIDPPDHRQYRALINPLLSARRIKELEPKIRAWCIELIDRFADRGHCRFADEFARIFPTGLFLDIMGWSKAELARFMDWEKRLLTSPTAEERAAALRELLGYLRAQIAARRVSPTDDLITWAVNARVDDRPTTDDEIVGIALLLYTAGLDTVTNSLSFVFRHLAEDQELQAQLRRPGADLARTIEEMLRLYSPATVQRMAAVDTTIGDVAVKAGDLVTVSTTGASRDPREFREPDSLHPERNPNPHFAFGFGVHRCAGAQLARLDMAIAVEEWLRRIPTFRLEDGAQPRYIGGAIMALDEVPLVWSSEATPE